jgi:MFS family permease
MLQQASHYVHYICHADDWAPPKAKSKWFPAFYLCIPVGFALGYIVGGMMTAFVSWWWTFVFEGLMMVPFVVFAATAQPLHLQGSEDKAHAPKGESFKVH